MNGPSPRRVLMVYLEPAPYVVGLVRALRAAWRGEIDVLYAAEALTQNWGPRRPEDREEILPASRRAAARSLWLRLSRRNYDLVHLAGWGHPLLLWSLLLAAIRRVPVVIESDTHVVRGATRWKHALKRLAYPYLFRIPGMFLPGGSPQAAYLQAFGVPSSRIKIAQMTSDVAGIREFASMRPIRAPNEPVRFLYLGRLEPHKGITDLLEGFAAMRRGESRAELLVAGSGSLATLVEGAAAREDAIRYLGHLSGRQVWDAYASADVFVLPSRVEPWGLVINEAMAAGLPVIATDQAGCAQDLVRDGVSGLIVPAGDPERLALAMTCVADDPPLRARMSAAAHAIISDWTFENAAKNTISAWLRCAA